MAVRKRPILEHREGGHYDVLTAVGARTLVCHEPKKDMKEVQTCVHHDFHFDHVFDDGASTEQVYQHAVAPSLHATLNNLHLRRANLTVFAYGQTGYVSETMMMMPPPNSAP